MIEITVDHNSDRVTIQDGKWKATFEKVKDTMQVQSILYETLNAFNKEGIRITSINEDERCTEGEW